MNNAHKIEQVLYAVDYDHGHLAILKISGHNVQLNPPLSIQQVDTAADLTGQYVFTVGYPATDPRIPREFTSAVLHNVFQVKRLIPGRIVSVFGNEGGFRVITSDASTFGGVAGGPVINIQTGRVLAIHIGGKWSEKEGKFAYSHLFSDLLADKKFPEELRNQLVENDVE